MRKQGRGLIDEPGLAVAIAPDADRCIVLEILAVRP